MSDIYAKITGILTGHHDVLVYGHLAFLAVAIALWTGFRGLRWWLGRRQR